MGLIALLFLPRLGHAHTPGLSMAELQVDAQGRVEARLTFASTEPRVGLSSGPEDLQAFVLDGVDVDADGQRCDPGYIGSSLTEGDGILLEATYACPTGATEIGLTLYYLSAFHPGHRVLARIVGPGGIARAEAVLRADQRALRLTLPLSGPSERSARAGSARLERAGAAVMLALAALLVALFTWRRGTRSRHGTIQDADGIRRR